MIKDFHISLIKFRTILIIFKESKNLINYRVKKRKIV